MLVIEEGANPAVATARSAPSSITSHLSDGFQGPPGPWRVDPTRRLRGDGGALAFLTSAQLEIRNQAMDATGIVSATVAAMSSSVTCPPIAAWSAQQAPPLP